MIEATIKISTEDLKLVKKFNDKIKREYEKFIDSVLDLDKKQLFSMSYKITFIRILKNYLISDYGPSINEIEEMINEKNILERAYNCFNRRFKDGYYLYDYEIEIKEIFDEIFNNY